MINLFKKFLGGASAKEEPVQLEAPVEYKEFQIIVCSKQVSGGWTTEAKIQKTIDGEALTHHFIRADKASTRDDAIELTLRKARITIDQVGDRLFS